MNGTLEVVVVPISDVDRAKAFYAEQLGFKVDHDTRVSVSEIQVMGESPPRRPSATAPRSSSTSSRSLPVPGLGPGAR